MFLKPLSYVLLTGSVALLLNGCSSGSNDPELALRSINEVDLAADIEIIASDEFEGRAPSTPAEEKTIHFLREEFKKIGLQPGNGQSYFQELALVEITANPDAKLSVSGETGMMQFQFGRDFVALTRHVVDEEELLKSEIVFVGYGIVAPKYDWNDYENLDMRGKTAIILVNDPGFATQDSALFDGRAMTYYGRWTYKYEEAARQGAAGALIIHETEPAAYPWAVVENSFTGPQMSLEAEDKNMSRASIEGWLHERAAREIFRMAGLDYNEQKARASQRDFSAVALGLEATITLENSVRHTVSNNVLAVLPGSNRADEYIIYVAHWDHLGKDTTRTDDPIFNGALDNATGTSGLLEIAEAFAKLEKRPSRSIVFLAVTAEEKGLLGSEYYAKNPVYPLAHTVAAMNMDGLNILGKMRDVTVVGYGNSELDDYVLDAAREQGRVVRPDPEPEKGSFFRADHFSFARQGIPVLFLGTGIDHVEHGIEWTLKQRRDYIAARYHKPSDEFDPAWDLSGAVDDLRLLFKIGYRLANESSFPNWREGVEFRAKRDSYMHL